MNSDLDHQLLQSLSQVRSDIAQAAKACQRNPEDITLLAVSKTQTAASIQTAYAAGQRHFGENYLQEAREKQEALAELDIVWHFIGPIQSNKTRQIAEHFDWVHGVDRYKIAQRLNDQRPENLSPLNICLQINIDEEATKAGLTLAQLPTLVEQLAPLSKLRLRGLMAIPAPKTNFAEQLSSFQRLTQAKEQFPQMDTLSIGMSDDFPAAIAAGSTLVRIGTGIFGRRKPANEKLHPN
jgi:hypothetical protein